MHFEKYLGGIILLISMKYILDIVNNAKKPINRESTVYFSNKLELDFMRKNWEYFK